MDLIISIFQETNDLTTRLPNWMTEPLFGVEGISLWKLSKLSVLILFGLVIRSIVSLVIVSQFQRFLAKFSFKWGRELLKNSTTQIGNLAFSGVLAFIFPNMDFPARFISTAMVAVRTFAAVSAVMLVYRSIDIFAVFLSEKAEKTETKLDDQLVPLISRALRLVTIFLGVIFVLQNLNVDVTSLLAGLTIGGLAFTLAAKDTVSNLFGSVTIFVDKPFAVGDWVNTAGVEGIVESIGFRSTRIRTFYNSLVSVPNNKFTESVVDNYGLREYRRVVAKIGVTYSTTPEQIEFLCESVRTLIKSHPKTRKDVCEIHCSGFSDSSIDIMVYYFVKTNIWSEELRTRHEIYLDIIRLMKKLHVNFAFPTRTLITDKMLQVGKGAETTADHFANPQTHGYPT